AGQHVWRCLRTSRSWRRVVGEPSYDPIRLRGVGTPLAGMPEDSLIPAQHDGEADRPVVLTFPLILVLAFAGLGLVLTGAVVMGTVDGIDRSLVEFIQRPAVFEPVALFFNGWLHSEGLPLLWGCSLVAFLVFRKWPVAGFWRVWSGAHGPPDVLGSVLIGSAFVLAMWLVVNAAAPGAGLLFERARVALPAWASRPLSAAREIEQEAARAASSSRVRPGGTDPGY